MARPTKRTPAAEEAILEALIAGCPKYVAAAAGGITDDTLAAWCAADPGFSERVKRAEGFAQQNLLAIIRKAASEGRVVTRRDGSTFVDPGDWTAAAWIMERRWPAEYGRRDRVTVDITAVVKQIAADAGLDPADVMAEAELILAGKR